MRAQNTNLTAKVCEFPNALQLVINQQEVPPTSSYVSVASEQPGEEVA